MFEDRQTETQVVLPRLAVVAIPALLAVSPRAVARWVPVSPFPIAGTQFQVGCAVSGFPSLAASCCMGQIALGSFPSSLVVIPSWGCWDSTLQRAACRRGAIPSWEDCSPLSGGTTEYHFRASSAGCRTSCIFAHTEQCEHMCSWMSVTI